MATNDQLKALVQSHGSGDDSQFYAVAMQVAAKAARGGQSKFAQELRELVDQLRAREGARAQIAAVLPFTQPAGELGSLLTVTYPQARLSDLVLAPLVRQGLEQVLLEQRQRDTLRRHNLRPARRLLLTGPPGTGKTSTARVVAGELDLPLFAIRLDTLITKFMGETAAKLRLVFDALAKTRGVYLFDEVDALAAERANPNDVGEIRRVLNSFLQLLEEDTSESVIIAATNHPQILDKAIFRRFDSIINFDLPTERDVQSVIENDLATFKTTKLSWNRVTQAAHGLSHAEVVASAETAAKRAVLSNRTSILTDDLVAALSERSQMAHQRGSIR